MKRLLLSAIILSSSAFAGNPELDAIFKKHEATLTNLKVGMSYVTNSQGMEMDDGDEMKTVPTKKTNTNILLKVDGAKTYEYEVSKNLISGEESVRVTLNDYSSDLNSDELSISNIKVIKDILGFNVSLNIEGDGYSLAMSGKFSINLNTPIICDTKTTLNSKLVMDGSTYDLPSSSVQKCVAPVSLGAIKKLDLTNVQFCDETVGDDEEESCEERDMSFLTANL